MAAERGGIYLRLSPFLGPFDSKSHNVDHLRNVEVALGARVRRHQGSRIAPGKQLGPSGFSSSSLRLRAQGTLEAARKGSSHELAKNNNLRSRMNTKWIRVV